MASIPSLQALAEGSLRPGIWRLDTAIPAARLLRTLRRRDFQVFEIEGREVLDKRSFLEASAAQLEFPDYFGFNWDAFVDSARDLSWLHPMPGAGIVIFYRDFTRFLREDVDEFKTALSCLNSVIDHWWEKHTPMYVLLRDEAESPLDSWVPLIELTWSLHFLEPGRDG